jgi:hypothetical protein
MDEVFADAPKMLSGIAVQQTAGCANGKHSLINGDVAFQHASKHLFL